MMPRHLSRLTAALLVSACAIQGADRQIDSNVDVAGAALADGERPSGQVAFGTVRTSSLPYVGGETHLQQHGEPLPAPLEGGGALTINLLRPATITETAQAISATAGVPVRVDLDSGRERMDAPDAPASPNGFPDPARAAAEALADADSGAGRTAAAGGRLAARQLAQRHSFRHTGSLSGLLDRVAQLYDLSWRNNNGAVTFYLFETKTFLLNSIPGPAKVDETLTTATSGSGSGSSGSSASGGGATTATTTSQTIGRKADLDGWTEIAEAIKAMTPAGSAVTASQSTSSITVTATPNSLRRVAEYVDRLNAEMARQIVLDVDVLSVELNRSDDASFDLSAALKRGGVSIAGPAGAGALDAFDGTALAINSTIGNQVFKNTVVKTLSSYGRVSEVSRQQLLTRNLQPVPFLDNDSQGYVYRTTTTTDRDGHPTTTGETSTVVTGFSATFLPRILSGGRLALQSTLSLSRLNSLEPPKGIDVQVQTPNTTTRSLMQEAILASGQTVLMASYQEMRDGVKREGTGGFWNFLFGGGATGSQKRSVVVILVTPHVVASPLQTAVE